MEKPIDPSIPVKKPGVNPDKKPDIGEEGQWCNGKVGAVCLGGYDSDKKSEDLPVRVVMASAPGKKLTDDSLGFSKNLIKKINSLYTHQGHRYLNLKLEKVIENDEGLSDRELTRKYAENNGKGVVTILIVENLPGATAGYVRNECAILERGQAWGVFELELTKVGVVEHEINHLFCFPHTSARQGTVSNFYLSGYNSMADILKRRGSYKKKMFAEFNIYIYIY